MNVANLNATLFSEIFIKNHLIKLTQSVSKIVLYAKPNH